jgi:hypothetical protein
MIKGYCRKKYVINQQTGDVFIVSRMFLLPISNGFPHGGSTKAICEKHRA